MLKTILKIVLPFVLGAAILWWMYRGEDFAALWHVVTKEMKWGWMLFSFVFGALAVVVRAVRWRMTLEPLGEKPRLRTAIDAVFLSYGASLVVPRIGEVMRCGTLKRMDGISFSKGVGTVLTERIVDSLLIVALTVLSLFSQLPVFLNFLRTTGITPSGLINRFTQTGYIVTAVCVIALVVGLILLASRYAVLRGGRDLLRDVKDGILSLRQVRRPVLYWILSISIWMCYFLHFYIAFFCFKETAGFPLLGAFLVFCVGSFAVLVPTPNGAGPWHFAVKTMLVIYGIAEAPAVMFALVVHTVQTLLVAVLGICAWADLNTIKIKR
ncbi:MAG: flippase-like domain-containing protein [Bacteroidaceae bacterium]|nr:flippase-like domain-containing protein [Bacteroidaceae bacterium]